MEDAIGRALSPYAVTKYVNELYAEVFARSYGFNTVGLRYFNVFGPRQDPYGAYAAVIPKWIASMIKNEDMFINGDGETSRDFCFIDNIVQANLLAAATRNADAVNQEYSVAFGERTTLNEVFEHLKTALAASGLIYKQAAIRCDFRIGYVRHSLANISKAVHLLGYELTFNIKAGIANVVPLYIRFASRI